jgi:hypothetical protein
MLHRLTNWWWSPSPPETYTYTVDGEKRGIGRVAYKLPAEFNLVWASNYKMLTDPKMELYIQASVNLASLNVGYAVEGLEVRDWLTLCKPEVVLPVFQHTDELPKLAKAQLCGALKSAIRLRSA